jgi:phage terminase large subunit-like protein
MTENVARNLHHLTIKNGGKARAASEMRLVCGTAADGVHLVLADLSVAGLSLQGWARRAAAAAEAWGAHRVIAEKNNGGGWWRRCCGAPTSACR